MSFGHRQITFAFFGTIDLSINCYAFLDLVSRDLTLRLRGVLCLITISSQLSLDHQT